TPDGAQTIPLAAVFPAIGAAPATQVLRGRAPVDGHGYLLADENGKTAIPGFFVAGDVRSKAVRQIVTACADGAAAAIAAGQYLRGSAD
ncbi:MAG: FAD-dependent oxidoreductase, partial [Oscillospiraceae bacterium]|nr:FAD-dependent oxidoreductase [Oscillospiraceae bacterium]